MPDPFDVLRDLGGGIEPSEAYRQRLLAELRAARAAEADGTGPPGGGDGRGPWSDAGVDATGAEPMRLDVEAPTRQRTSRRTALLVGGAIAAAVALIVALVAVVNRERDDAIDTIGRPASTRPVDSSTATSGPASSASGAGTAGLPAVQPLEALGPSTAMAIGAGGTPGVWSSDDAVAVLHYSSSDLQIFDVATGDARQTVKLPFIANVDAAMSPGVIWVPSGGNPLDPMVNANVAVVDPRTGAIVAIVAVPQGNPDGPTSSGDGSGLWLVGSGSPQSLVHISGATKAIDKTLPAPQGTTNAASGPAGLWAARLGGKLTRLDPEDGRELATVTVPMSETWLVKVVDGDVWGLGYDSRQRLVLARIDPSANALVASIVVGENVDLMAGYGFDIGGGHAWIRSPEATVVDVDLATNTVVGRYGTGGEGYIAYHDHTLWATDAHGNLYRISVA